MKTINQIIKNFSSNSLMVEILVIQQNQLEYWKERLNSKYYNALVDKVKKENDKLTIDSDPYRVFRGNDMTEFISITHL